MDCALRIGGWPAGWRADLDSVSLQQIVVVIGRIRRKHWKLLWPVKNSSRVRRTSHSLSLLDSLGLPGFSNNFQGVYTVSTSCMHRVYTVYALFLVPPSHPSHPPISPILSAGLAKLQPSAVRAARGYWGLWLGAVHSDSSWCGCGWDGYNSMFETPRAGWYSGIYCMICMCFWMMFWCFFLRSLCVCWVQSVFRQLWVFQIVPLRLPPFADGHSQIST